MTRVILFLFLVPATFRIFFGVPYDIQILPSGTKIAGIFGHGQGPNCSVGKYGMMEIP